MSGSECRVSVCAKCVWDELLCDSHAEKHLLNLDNLLDRAGSEKRFAAGFRFVGKQLDDQLSGKHKKI